MELGGKRVVVVGLGASGRAAVRLCASRGAHVIGTDRAPADDISPGIRSLTAEWVLGGHEGVDFEAADLVVVSPGVPNFEALERAEKKGVPVISEVKLALAFLDAPLIAVGGTNGKSTTTTMLRHLFEAAQRRVFVGGNLGVPASAAVGTDPELIILELSSFQLERSPGIKPKASVLLNISEDHLDRYEGFQQYADTKGLAFVNQTDSDFAFYPTHDDTCLKQVRRGGANLISFGPDGDYYSKGRSIVETVTEQTFSLEDTDLYGTYNFTNATASIAVARTFGITTAEIEEGFARFRALPHRMALVGQINGVRFYDDSKATNVGAAVTALLGLVEPSSVLIAGGRDKQGSYAPLVAALEKKARAVVVIGEAASRIEAAVDGRLLVERADTMTEAVERAFSLARSGDAVLLSPACSSLDMFRDYAERGDHFVRAFEQLGERMAEENLS